MNLKYNEKNNQRIDKYLVSLKLEELFSRSFIDKLINSKNIRVNNLPIKKSHLLKSGDEIEITIPKVEDSEIIPENIPLAIVYDDKYLAIVNKPAGLTVHPAPGNASGTLVNALMFHFKENLSKGTDGLRPGIVHRLDKDTSGLLIVAKDNKTHSILSRMFQERMIKKYYKAIIVGIPGKPEGIIETYMDRSKSDRKKMSVSISGKKAITSYKIEQYFNFFSLVQIELKTGRTHQIRVHFSYINCPILGDNTYSNLKRTLNSIPHNFQKKVKYLLANHLKRQALHASKIHFNHPITNKEILIEIPLPDDMQYCLKWLNQYFSS